MILIKLSLAMVLFLFFISTSAAYEYYEAGKKAYQEEDYEKANLYLGRAVHNHPDHLRARYYYAQALIQLGKNSEAQKHFKKIIEISPQSYEARMASIGISKLEKYRYEIKGFNIDNTEKSALSKKSRLISDDNYIENALESGMVTRWSSDKMPIKLYIERPNNLSGYKPSYYADVKRAMDSWVFGAGSDLISYTLINNPDEADIRVYFVNEIFKRTGDNYITGLATPFIRGSILNYYEVKFIPHDELYTTALHELGHALGLRGHSSDESDIMYSAVNDVKRLSTRDKNTIRELYGLKPDISNFDGNEKAVNDTNENEKILGSKDGLLEKKLKEAIEYSEKYPNNVLSWIHLGKAYFDLGKYEQAAASYEKAVRIDSTYTNAKVSLALTYKHMGKTKEAERLLEELVRIEPDNIIFANNYAYFLVENKRFVEAKAVLQNLFKANPEAENDENIRQLMNYMENVSQ